MTITYICGDTLYVNITNRCSNRCTFCVRNNHDTVNEKDVLWLEREPSRDEILDDILKRDLSLYKELCFCGFGEPTYRIDDIIYISGEIKKVSPIPIRINTNGHANLIAGRDVTPGLKGIIDILSISLNASNSGDYDELCKSLYGDDAFTGMLDFAKKAREFVPDVRLTVVDVLPQEEIEKCRKLASEAGVSFRVRKYIK